METLKFRMPRSIGKLFRNLPNSTSSQSLLYLLQGKILQEWKQRRRIVCRCSQCYSHCTRGQKPALVPAAVPTPRPGQRAASICTRTIRRYATFTGTALGAPRATTSRSRIAMATTWSVLDRGTPTPERWVALTSRLQRKAEGIVIMVNMLLANLVAKLDNMSLVWNRTSFYSVTEPDTALKFKAADLMPTPLPPIVLWYNSDTT